ncbi:MFS transporter, partial [Intrasporangium sp.]|uniref:MFS transporter n=1 Tax=Intrasporangium sp. TaxID=1925024 RepID=UPI00293A4040
MGANDAQPGRLAVTRAALRSGRLRRVVTAFLVFSIVEWATWIAILVWAFEQGGLRSSSLIALVQLVPAALLAPVIAAWSGRRRPVTALVTGYAAQGVAFSATGAALIAGAPYVISATLACLGAITITMTRPVHHALLPRIAQTTGELTVGNAASGSAEALAVVLGPLACAALIGPTGAGGVVLVMGLSCLGCAALTSGLRLEAGGAAQGLDRSPTQLARAILRHPAARTLTSLVSVEHVLVGTMDILLVVLAIDLLGLDDSGPALLNAALGVGGLVGAAATILIATGTRVVPGILVGALVCGIAFAVTALSPTAVAAGVLLAVTGAGKVFFDVSLRTLVQRALPEHLLTAVFGLMEAVTMAAIALGSVLVPLLVELAGTRGAFVLSGMLLPLAGLVLLRRLLRLDTAATVPADALGLLEGVPILSVLAPRVLDRLAIESRRESVPEGTEVVRQGAPGDTFHVIRSGTAAVRIDDDLVRELGPGDWFGELALLHDTPRTATVSALTDLDLQTLERDEFLAFVAHVPRAVEEAETHARDTYR